MDINKGRFSPINIENFSWSFVVSTDIFDVLSVCDMVVVLRKTDKELVLFTKEKWLLFVSEMEENSGFDKIQLNYTKEWKAFINSLFRRAQPVSLKKNNKISINSKSTMKQILEWKDFSVSFCV